MDPLGKRHGSVRALSFAPAGRAAGGVEAEPALFSALDGAARGRLLRASRTVNLRSRMLLWREGEPARNLGLLLSGRLKVIRSSGRGATLLDIMVPGDLLGAAAFASGSTYQADLVALRESSVLLVPRETVRALLRQAPQAAESLASQLAEQVSRLYRAAEDLSACTVRQRLARVLLRLGERLGEPLPGGVFVAARLQRSDLAAMAATTLESVSRQVSDWQRRGYLDTNSSGYVLRNVAALARFAEAAP